MKILYIGVRFWRFWKINDPEAFTKKIIMRAENVNIKN
jgi:hypothetical protein